MGDNLERKSQAKYILKAVLFCTVFVGLFVLLSFIVNITLGSFGTTGLALTGTASGLLANYLFLKYDRKKFADIGLYLEPLTLIRFLAGVVAGVLMMGLLTAGVLYFNHVNIQVNRTTTIIKFIVHSLPLIPLAFMEELGFRAYPLEILKNKISVRWTIVITSLLFALYHIVSGWTVASSFYGPGIWGLIFGLAAIYSRGIAMPTGIHFAANLVQSAFGSKNKIEGLWVVNQPQTTNQPSVWPVLLPALAVLIFAIVCIEIYMRTRPRHAIVHS